MLKFKTGDRIPVRRGDIGSYSIGFDESRTGLSVINDSAWHHHSYAR